MAKNNPENTLAPKPLVRVHEISFPPFSEQPYDPIMVPETVTFHVRGETFQVLKDLFDKYP